jgi:hypothetical protein
MQIFFSQFGKYFLAEICLHTKLLVPVMQISCNFSKVDRLINAAVNPDNKSIVHLFAKSISSTQIVELSLLPFSLKRSLKKVTEEC